MERGTADINVTAAMLAWLENGLNPGSYTRLLLLGRYDEAKNYAHPHLLEEEAFWDIKAGGGIEITRASVHDSHVQIVEELASGKHGLRWAVALAELRAKGNFGRD